MISCTAFNASLFCILNSLQTSQNQKKLLQVNVHPCNLPQHSLGTKKDWDETVSEIDEDQARHERRQAARSGGSIFEAGMGLHVHSCGHRLHLECLKEYL